MGSNETDVLSNEEWKVQEIDTGPPLPALFLGII